MTVRSTILACSCFLFGQFVFADEPPEQADEAVRKGLAWLVDQQKPDGHWEEQGGRYAISVTSFAGMALLMEGSTLREGQYADRLRRAVDWLLEHAQPNGLIEDAKRPNDGPRTIFANGHAMLFLAAAYGEEETSARRRRIEAALTKAVRFAGEAQTKNGGWGYVPAAEGGDFDEGCATGAQLEGLAACHVAGVVVPRSITDKARKYLEDATAEKGGVVYSLSRGAGNSQERPALTAHELANKFVFGERQSDLPRRWLRFCRDNIPLDLKAGGFGEYTHHYYAQAICVLGEDGYEKLFPDSKPEERLTWSKYRSAMFPKIMRIQQEDGSWKKGIVPIGPIYSTTMYLSILQQDKKKLSVYQ